MNTANMTEKQRKDCRFDVIMRDVGAGKMTKSILASVATFEAAEKWIRSEYGAPDSDGRYVGIPTYRSLSIEDSINRLENVNPEDIIEDEPAAKRVAMTPEAVQAMIEKSIKKNTESMSEMLSAALDRLGSKIAPAEVPIKRETAPLVVDPDGFLGKKPEGSEG